MNQTKGKKHPLFIIIPIFLLLILLRFSLSYLKSDGFNGLSMALPTLLLGFLVTAFCASACFAAWVWQDCKKRGDDPVLWAIVIFIASPLIGLLIYFLRRSELKRACPACSHRISLQANFCEECGTQIKNKEETIMLKQGTHHLSFLISGVLSLALMLMCLTGFIVSAVTGNGINSDVTSDDRIWNLGVITLYSSSERDGVWKLNFKSASEGFIEEHDMKITDAKHQTLYADISCKTVPKDTALILWLVQGETARSADVTNLSEPLEIPLHEFENGKLHVRLQINGVKDTVSEIYIQ